MRIFAKDPIFYNSVPRLVSVDWFATADRRFCSLYHSTSKHGADVQD